MKNFDKKKQYLMALVLTIWVWVAFVQTTDTEGLIRAVSANQALVASSLEHPSEGLDLVAFSPDGNTLASADSDGQIVLWDVASGLTRMTIPSQFASPVSGIIISPDGNTLASLSDNLIRLWDVTSGGIRSSLPESSFVTNWVFSPDGKTLALVDQDARLTFWDSQSGTTTQVLTGYKSGVNALAFSPDSKILVTGGRDGQVKLWNRSTGLEQAGISGDVGAVVTNLIFSPDGKTLAVAGEDARIMLWNSQSGSTTQILTGHQSRVNVLAFSPDSKVLASGGQDAQIKFWDMATGLEQASLGGEAGVAITDLVFSPDGKTFSSIGESDLVFLWDVLNKQPQLLTGHRDWVIKVVFSANKKNLVSLDKTGQVVVWNLMTGLKQQTFQIPTLLGASLVSSQTSLSGNPVSNTSLQLTASNTPSVTKNSSIASTQVASKDNTSKKRSAQKWKGIRALAISQDGLEMGTAGEDGSIRVFKKNGSQRWEVSGHHGNAIAGIAFRGKTKEWVSAGRDTEIKTWGATGKNLQTFYGPEHPPRVVAVSPDGRFIATAGEETRVFLYDADAGKLRATFSGHVDFVNGLAFSPDGKILASAGAEGRIILWEVATGKPLRTLLGHADEVNAVAFSPDGGLLASASADSTVILWNSTTGAQVKALAGHQGSVRSVAFSPNGKKLVSAGEDTRMLVWDPKTGQLMKQLGAGPPSAINALTFGPDGNLHVASENSEVSEFNTDTDTKLDTLIVPVSTTVGPQVNRSEALTLATASNLGLLTPSLYVEKPSIAEVKQSNSILNSMVNQLLDWVIPAANAALPDPNQGPGGPILVVTTPSDPFGKYYAEILRTEGLNAFAIADISGINATTLASYDVVILASMTLISDQVTMFTEWVTAGGNLITMRPDAQLAGLLGVNAIGTSLSNGYLLVDTSGAPGNGIVNQTLQFHGDADLYSVTSASTLATLYTNATTATANPAVTLRSVGPSGGQAAAFTYDLATSIVYTRQGNPAWALQERDGFSPIRSDDKFFGNATGDPQVDWVDFNKIAIPQADEQQRLLANLILEMNRDKKPLPRFWYFPNGKKAVVIMTGDDHANNGTPGRFDQFIANSTPGCSVANWECIRGTSYIYPNTALTNTQAASYNAQGFEVGLHVNTNCADYTPTSLRTFYTGQIDAFRTKYSSIPAPITQRHHCIAWSDWVTGAIVQLENGIRFDTSYYFWPPGWVLNRPGFFSGSGMPMRFANDDGSMIDVYHAASQMTDESGQTYPFTIDTLLDRALGTEGYYGAFTINAHTDSSTIPESDAVIVSAPARGVPIVSSKQMLDWLDGRNSSSFGALTWSGNTLSFTVTTGSGANNLRGMLPASSNAGVLLNIIFTPTSGSPAPLSFTVDTIKGVPYSFFPASAGTYTATYGADTTPPTVESKLPSDGASSVSVGTAITAVFNEAMDVVSINSLTVELRDSANALVNATINYNANTRTATLTPSASLAGSTTYTATIKGGTADADPRVKDLAGNALAANVTWSFTTEAQPCSSSSCSAWSSSTIPGNPQENDPGSVELGVKFKSDINGLITGIRFYQVNASAGAGRTFQATLWNLSGQQLATGSITSTSSGWQQVNFSTPFAITANTVYIASYFAPNGNYAANGPSFLAAGVDNPPIHLLKDGVNGFNGVYKYGAISAFPTDSYQSSNYWVDVVFSTNVGPDTTPPTVSSTTPTAGATGVNPANPVTVTFSEPMTVASISNLTFQLQDPTNDIVAASVTYNAGTNTATLTPTSSLAASTVYTAKVLSGVSGVKDSAGNPLAVDNTWSFTTGVDPCSTGGNPIVCENSKTGNPSSEWDISGAGDLSIQGYATDISVNRGQTVRFKINTPSTDYRLDIYRMGFYGGNGARKVATVQPSATLPQTQLQCLTHAATGLVDCGNWAESASWDVPADAASGIYFAKVIREDGANTGASHIVFIVRDDASTSDILFQTADTTWQAYNTSGGNTNISNSFYGGTGPGTGSGSGRAYKLSYNRPFNTRSVDSGQDWVFNAEYPMVRWLEANGYNVSYFTGVDSDRFGSLIRNHKLFLSNAHDEYWSGQQRANVEAARDAVVNPVNLAFFSGNEVFWKTRWENNIINTSGSLGTDGYRTLVCFKETHNFPNNTDPLPGVWTGTWRDPRGSTLLSPKTDGGRPENALMGPIFTVNDGATTSITVPEADGKMRFWRNTSIANLASGTSATLPNGTLGYEWDEDLDNGFRPAGLVRLSTTIVPNAPVLTDYGSTFGSGTANHALTLYKAPSGAIVFGAGTVQWAWGLDSSHDRTVTPTDANMKQATVNLFADMGVQPSTIQSGLLPATASTDVTSPASTIVAPASGANIALGSVVTINGTASDAVGGRVGGVEVSFDGGLSWHPAEGRTNWTYSWIAPSINGQVNIKARAVDDSLNLEIAGAGITVNVGTGSDTTAPTAPGSLSATATSGTQVSLTWTASTDNVGVTGYQVERCQGTGCNNFVQIATPIASPFSDSGLTEGTTYRYRVRAADGAGNLSTYSSIVTAIPDATAPVAPGGLSATATSSTQINLAWTATTDNVGVTGYRVERCQGAGCSAFAQIATPTAASFADSALTGGTTYQYRVRATDAAGNLSLYSAVASVTTQAVPVAPVAVADTFLFRASILRTIDYTGPLGMGVLANDSDSVSLALTAQAVGTLPAGVALGANGVVTINRTANTTFRYRANNGTLLSLPPTGTLVTLRLDGVPTTVAENCTYNRSGNGTIASGSACTMTITPRVFTMSLTANDSDPNVTTNIPTDGVGDAVTGARITATGTGVAVSANAACGQAEIVKAASRATITNNCNGTITVTVAATAPASPISLTYRALDDLGAQSSTRNDVITVQ